MAIGGLKDKFLGAIKSGVKLFLYPEENQKDFYEFKEQYNNDNDNAIQFKSVKNIKDVFEGVFE